MTLEDADCRPEDEPQEEMSYQDYCDWYAVHGNPEQDHWDHEANSHYDEIRERYSPADCGDMAYDYDPPF